MYPVSRNFSLFDQINCHIVIIIIGIFTMHDNIRISLPVLYHCMEIYPQEDKSWDIPASKSKSRKKYHYRDFQAPYLFHSFKNSDTISVLSDYVMVFTKIILKVSWTIVAACSDYSIKARKYTFSKPDFSTETRINWTKNIAQMNN